MQHAAVDWNEVTAIGTWALLGGVIVAALGIKAARQAAQDDLRASYRPLLIDVPRWGPVTADMESYREGSPAVTSGQNVVGVETGHRVWTEIDPREPYVELSQTRGIVSVPLRNVGRGLAVLNAAAVVVGVADSIETVVVDRPRVPPGETTRVTAYFKPSQDAEQASGFSVVVPYADFAGTQKTEATVLLLEETADAWRVSDIEQFDAHAPGASPS
jgi:hypothetical protein